jgi:hypothetical protein
MENKESNFTGSETMNIEGLIEKAQTQKPKYQLTNLMWQRIAELIIGFPFALFFCLFFYTNINELSLAISAAIILVFIVFAMVSTAHQIFLILKFRTYENVLKSQEILGEIQAHIFLYLRLSILQFPFYMAYVFIGFKMFFGLNLWQVGDKNYLLVNLLFSLILVPVSIYFFRKIRAKNMNVKWVNSLLRLTIGKRATLALENLNSIEQFRQNHE